MSFKQHKIKKRNDFLRIFKEGDVVKNEFFILRILKNEFSYFRFAVIVSKKVSKKAVIRNKIRRRVSEAVRTNLDKFKKGIDVIIIILPPLVEKSFKETKETLLKLFQKAKILNNV